MPSAAPDEALRCSTESKRLVAKRVWVSLTWARLDIAQLCWSRCFVDYSRSIQKESCRFCMSFVSATLLLELGIVCRSQIRFRQNEEIAMHPEDVGPLAVHKPLHRNNCVHACAEQMKNAKKRPNELYTVYFTAA